MTRRILIDYEGQTVPVDLDGSAGDYNVHVHGVFIGRVRQESKRYPGQRKMVRWQGRSPWTWDGRETGPAGETVGGRRDARYEAIRAVIQRAVNHDKILTP